MTHLNRMVAAIKQGREFCGYCGKEVTNAPDCMHKHSGASTTSKSDPDRVHSKGVLKYLRPVRISEVYLMYIDEMLALPVFDPVLKPHYPTTKSMFQMNELFKRKPDSAPVRYTPINRIFDGYDGVDPNNFEHNNTST